MAAKKWHKVAQVGISSNVNRGAGREGVLNATTAAAAANHAVQPKGQEIINHWHKNMRKGTKTSCAAQTIQAEGEQAGLKPKCHGNDRGIAVNGGTPVAVQSGECCHARRTRIR